PNAGEPAAARQPSKAAGHLVNYASRQPLSRLWGQGNTCSADGMRFYVPVHILAADYSPVLQDRGVTLFAHTADNFLRLHQQPIPCRLREATFSLDGLLEHDTELDPRVCYTDTHGYTEVVIERGLSKQDVAALFRIIDWMMDLPKVMTEQ